MSNGYLQTDGIAEINIKGLSVRVRSQSTGDYIIKLTNTYDVYIS